MKYPLILQTKAKENIGIVKTLIIIPAYNERESIVQTVDDIIAHASEMDYIVINDCSTDDTRDILKANHIPYLDLPVNLGIGGGVQTGYRYAQEMGYEIVVQFDGDGQHMAQYIQELTRPIELGQSDVVIGSRFLKNEGFQSSMMRRLGISFLSKMISLLCGVHVWDVTSGMRAVNKRMICVFAQNYAQDYPEPEAILASGLIGANVIEIPVQMRERQGGKSSINVSRSIYYMLKVTLALILSRLGQKKVNRK